MKKKQLFDILRKKDVELKTLRQELKGIIPQIKKEKPRSSEYYIAEFMQNFGIDYRLWKWNYVITQAQYDVIKKFRRNVSTISYISTHTDNYQMAFLNITNGVNFFLNELSDLYLKETSNPKTASKECYIIFSKFLKGIEDKFKNDFGIEMGEYYTHKGV